VWLRGSHVSLPTFSIQKCCGPLLPSKHHTALQQQQQQQQLEKASTHRSAKTHTNTVFVPHDFDLSYPKINRFLGLMVEHFCLKFGNPTCSVFIYHAKNRWTHTGRCTNKQITIDRQTNATENHTATSTVGMGDNINSNMYCYYCYQISINTARIQKSNNAYQNGKVLFALVKVNCYTQMVCAYMCPSSKLSLASLWGR